MYQSHERAGIFGWYLLGPLLGPSIGPLLGGIILSKLDWPWLFWVLLIICSVAIAGAFVFLKETYTPVLLAKRKQDKENADGGEYYFDGEDVRPLKTKLASSIQRPLRILFTQPIVLIMASYQALIFATNYSLYTQFQ
jgi:MFS family permease